MSSQQAVNPQKRSRGSRRRPRKSVDTTPSHISSLQTNSDFSEDPGRQRDPDQPTRILRQNDYDNVRDVSIAGNLELPNPSTPPRPRSMYDEFSYSQNQGNQSAPDISQQRKKGRKSHGGITRASGVSKSEMNESPVSARPRQPLTPNRPNATPARAYAGPTFHASPAASSLPKPKFFSKSVPDVDKTSSLTSMMDQEVVGTTSESDSSPFLAKSQPRQVPQARENSPLDIFFQADRDAKAQAQAQNRSSAVSNSLWKSSQNDVRHHSRQPTDSSVGGMFPLEMDGAAAEISVTKSNKEPTTPVPKVMTEAERKDQQRKAQTLELKKLLYSPKPQRSPSSSPCADASSNDLDSASPKTNPRGGSPARVPNSTDRGQQRHAALLALAQKQISGTGISASPVPQRPPSSKLWKEMTVPCSPGVEPPELPATPTQSRVQKTSTPTNGNTRPEQNGYATPHAPFATAFSPPATSPSGSSKTPSRQSRDAKSIEEDLRRILKLDVLGGDEGTGVPS